MSKEEKKLHEYIIKKLKSPDFSGICSISNRSPHTLNTLSTSILKNILTTKFDNGADMHAVVCMFDNIFSRSVNKKNKNGLYQLSNKLSQWIKKYYKLNTDSTSGYIYITDIFTDIEVLIKIPQHSRDDNNIIREYFIGISEINKIRYIVPTFVYTLGAFLCPIENGILCNKKPGNKSNNSAIPFVIFEKIPGKNMEEMLKSDSLTFPEFLGMFLQILLGLEVAQRNISFCHYDFHSANLMCRTIDKEYKYTVPLDNNLYDINAKKYLPVIIDFGLSTVKSNDRIVGSYEFKKHGMLNYMLPGVDMYKFLVYCIVYAKNDMHRHISNLLLFYGDDDPYKILVEMNGVDKAISDYVKKCSYSGVTTRTPLEFIEWILVQPEYVGIVSNYVNKRNRNVYIPLSFSTLVNEYEILFNNPSKIKENAIELINNCSEGYEGSYIMSMYYLYVLEGYISNARLNVDSFFGNKANVSLIRIKSMISNKENIHKMIHKDLNMLFDYKNLDIPNMMQINDYSKRLLNVRINSFTNKKGDIILKLVSKYFDSIIFFEEILDYLQFVYTIKELKLEKEYKNFLVEFFNSVQYKIYANNYMLINKTTRWTQSLLVRQSELITVVKKI